MSVLSNIVSYVCVIIGFSRPFVVGFNLEVREPIQKSGEIGSYFGYSIAEHRISNNSIKADSWILVGAPLGQNLQPGTNRSGALFKCPITADPFDCSQVPTDGRRYEDSNSLSEPLSDEIKDNQWLGATVRSQGVGGKVLVCAHRYVHKIADSQWGQGLCYVLTNNLEYDETYEPCKGRPTDFGHQQFGFCQAGTNGVLLADGTAIIGTPGPYTWRGTMFVIEVGGNFLTRDKTLYMTPLNDSPNPVDKYSYLGMSVTAGNFMNPSVISYAAGAPRSNDTGEVIIFEKRPQHSIMNVIAVLHGEQFASSFGYELTSADLNNDGLSDLIVGAPFYFTKTDGGAVYIFMNENNAKCYLKCKKPVKLTGRPESRFGFALSNLGDLNKDGYADIAIGAPYEDNRGAVYIYFGSKTGITLKPAQILYPEPKIRTLGYSLSGGIDMDLNGYPDLLVGAFESDSVFLYKSRPIIDIMTKIDDRFLKNIDVTKTSCSSDPISNYTCFTFKVCCALKWLSSTHSNSAIPAQYLYYKIEAETFHSNKKYSRVFFKSKTNRYDQTENVQNRVIKLRSDKSEYCQEEIVYLKDTVKDILSPIKFNLNYTLGENKINSPILNQQEASKIFSATFQKDCGSNDFCETNLVVSSSLLLPSILNYFVTGARISFISLDSIDSYCLLSCTIALHCSETVTDNATKAQCVKGTFNEYILNLGEQDELKLDVNVTNSGEPAYEAQLFIEHSNTLNYIAIDDKFSNITCNFWNETVIRCTLGNPFKTNRQVMVRLRFELKFQTDFRNSESNDLVFRVYANSTSKEINNETNSVTLRAQVVKKAEVSINGAATSNVFYGGETKGESAMDYLDEIGSLVIHTYQVVNNGPWNVDNLNVEINWPLQVANNKPQGKWLLFLEEMPRIDYGFGSDGSCFLDENFINPLSLKKRPGYHDEIMDSLVMEKFYQSKETPMSLRRSKRNVEMVVKPEYVLDEDGHRRQIVNLNCKSKTAKCIRIDCSILNLGHNKEATITIKSRIWNSTLIEDYPNVDWVNIASDASISIPKELSILQDQSDDSISIVTLAYPDLGQQGQKAVPTWIIIVAIVVGLFLLILLSLCLYKLGFFKRNRFQQTITGTLKKKKKEETPFLS